MTMVSIMVKKISGRAESPPPVRSSQQNRAFSHFFVLHFPYMARDPTIFLVNFITFCALNKWSKFGENGRCLNIFKTKKLHYLLHYPIVSMVKCMRLQCIFQKFSSVTPSFFSTNVLHPCSCINMKNFRILVDVLKIGHWV